MTFEELKAAIEPIILNESITVSQRTDLLCPIMKRWYEEHEFNHDLNAVFNGWNLAMAELIDKHALRRH